METAASSDVHDLITVRERARTILQRPEVLGGGWSVRGVRRLDRQTVVFHVEPDDGLGLSLEWSEPMDAGFRAFKRGPRYAAGYRRGPQAWDLDAAETPEEIKQLAERACLALSQAVEDTRILEPDPDDSVEAPETHLPFNKDAVAEWLGAKLKVGDELASGWRLQEVYPHGLAELAVAFEHTRLTFTPRLKLRLREEDAPAAFRTRNLDLTYTLAYGEAVDDGRRVVYEELAAELGLVLEALDRSVQFVAPPAAAKDSRPMGEGEKKAPGALNLAIPAPCGQVCNFCSIREEIFVVKSADSPLVRRLKRDIVRSAGLGTKVLRVNGIEPLNAPYLFDLLDLAREEGFEEFHLLSTCRPLANREFAERFISAQPERYRIYVPIYGSNPAVHDGQSGKPGAFNDVMAAVTNLRELMGEGGTLIFSTVLTQQNLHDVVGMRDLVKPLGRWWEVHLPFPNTSSKTDRYRDVSVRFSDALDAIYPEGWWPLADLPLGEIPPCVAVQHEEKTGHALLTPHRLEQRAADPAGTFYRSAGFDHSGGDNRAAFTSVTTNCPHADSCDLSAVCPGKVYGLYDELHGLDELAPITASRMLDLSEGAAVLRWLTERGLMASDARLNESMRG